MKDGNENNYYCDVVSSDRWWLFDCAKSQEARTVLAAETIESVALFKEKDPSIQKFFDRSYGYAVLPKVFKGGFWVGGAHGKGELFEKDVMVGYCSMSQATIGFSFGGEFFREIIFGSSQSLMTKRA